MAPRLDRNVALGLLAVGLALLLLLAWQRRTSSLYPEVGPQTLGEPEPPKREFGRPRR